MVEELDAVLESQFRIAMGGDEVVLGSGDRVRVPAGTVEAADMVGDDDCRRTISDWFADVGTDIERAASTARSRA